MLCMMRECPCASRSGRKLSGNGGFDVCPSERARASATKAINWSHLLPKGVPEKSDRFSIHGHGQKSMRLHRLPNPVSVRCKRSGKKMAAAGMSCRSEHEQKSTRRTPARRPTWLQGSALIASIAVRTEDACSPRGNTAWSTIVVRGSRSAMASTTARMPATISSGELRGGGWVRRIRGRGCWCR